MYAAVPQQKDMFVPTRHLCLSKRKELDLYGYPQIIHFNKLFHYKQPILGYHYFCKHPYGTDPQLCRFWKHWNWPQDVFEVKFGKCPVVGSGIWTGKGEHPEKTEVKGSGRWIRSCESNGFWVKPSMLIWHLHDMMLPTSLSFAPQGARFLKKSINSIWHEMHEMI